MLMYSPERTDLTINRVKEWTYEQKQRSVWITFTMVCTIIIQVKKAECPPVVR